MASRKLQQSLAQTYNHPSYEDPYDAVRDYRRVQQAAATNPEKSSYALADELDLPRSRIRGWIDEESDTMPDAARAIEIAHNMGWIEPHDDRALPLAALAGHLLAGGSIAQSTYVPSICEGRRVSTIEIERAFQAVGVRPTRRHEQSDNRATEVYPAEHASVLGRTLSAWGCPVGGRNDIRSPPKLIVTLGDAGRKMFLESYVSHRAVTFDSKATCRLQGEQPESFHEAIAKLIMKSTGESVSYGSRGVTVSAAAMQALEFAE